jgi:ADP-heptose:LPS heptosyltransferase
MRTTLVINLTRFGDLIQTQPVLSAYKRQGDRVVVVCLEQFAKAVELLADVDRVCPLPGARLLARLDTRWTAALETVFEFVSSESTEEGTVNVVNLTPSLSSRLLGSLYARSAQRGFGLDAYGFGLYSSPWANFLQAASKLRGCSPFNLVDVMVRVAHLPCRGDRPRLKDPDPATLAWCARLLREEAPVGAEGFVVFQLGASQDIRRWPVEHFARLGEHLWAEHGLCPVIVGADNEKHLGERYAALTHASRIDLIGRTDLAQLAGVLRQARLLVTNDTGTMHMGAGLGIPIVAIFLATAQPWDTGPYLEHCVCLEPDMDCHPCSFSLTCDRDHACRKRIRPELVGELVDGFLADGMWKMEAGKGARGWRTVLEDGMMDLVSLTGDSSDRVSWVRIQRWYYRHFLDGEDLKPCPGVFPLSEAVRKEIMDTLTRCRGLLHLFREQTALLVRMPSPAMHEKFMRTWQQIQTNLEQSRWVGILGLLWAYQTQDLGSDALKELVALVDRFDALLGSLVDQAGASKTA